MKKLLLSFASLVFLANSYAQEPETDYTLDKTWMNTVNEYYCVKLDTTHKKEGIKDLTSNETQELLRVATWNTAIVQSAIVEDNTWKISHKRVMSDNNFADLSLNFTEWIGGSTIKFKGQETSNGKAADTLVGMYVDMRNTPEIRVFVKTDVDFDLRFDLVDANGHVSDSKTQHKIITAGNGQYYTFLFPNDHTLLNWYTGDFWGVNNGRYATSTAPSQIIVKGTTYTFSQQDNIPFDLSKVVGFRFMINDGSQGKINQPINIEMSDMTIGTVEKAVPFVRYHYDSPALIANPANVILAKYFWDMDNSKIPENGNSTNPTDTLPEPYLSISDLLTPETLESARLVVADLSEMERIAISEDVLKTLLGEDITVIVSDSLVVWYYKADNGLKADASWEIIGYGPNFKPKKYGIYMAEINNTKGELVAVTKQYTVALGTPVAELAPAELAITYSAGDITLSQPARIAVYSSAGACVAQGTGTSLTLPQLPAGVYIAKASTASASAELVITIQ